MLRVGEELRKFGQKKRSKATPKFKKYKNIDLFDQTNNANLIKKFVIFLKNYHNFCLDNF